MKDQGVPSTPRARARSLNSSDGVHRYSRPTAAADSETQTERLDLFECNICLDAAQEPVVTFCGHLYCWACVYRWLDISAEPSCPVCKTTISPKRMVPVYGRGKPNLDPRAQFVDEPFSAANAKAIPDRPRGRRIDGRRVATEGGEGAGSAGAVPIPALSHVPSFSLLGCVACVRVRENDPRSVRAPARPTSRAGAWPNTAAPLGVANLYPGLGSVVPFGLQFVRRAPVVGIGGRVLTRLAFALLQISNVVPQATFITGEARTPEQAQQAFLSRLLLLLGSFVILCLLLF